MEAVGVLQDAVCLELPLEVVNLDKAIDAVGGPSEISRVGAQASIAKDSEGLQLNLRNCRFHHAISSSPLLSRNLVVNISLPKSCYGGDMTNVVDALKRGAQQGQIAQVTPKLSVKQLHRFREVADFQYYTADSAFLMQLEQSIFKGDLAEIQKLSLQSKPELEDVIPPPRFTLSTQPFYYGYKQSPYVKFVDDESGQQRLIHTSSTAKVISNVLNWGDPVPNEPPEELENNPRDSIKQCIKELESLFEQRPSYTRRSLQHKLGSYVSRYLKYALPYVSYYYRSGPWRGAYIRYGRDPSSDSSMARFQVEHFRIAVDDASKSGSNCSEEKFDESENTANGEYVFDGTNFPDVPLLQLADIADGYLEQYINTDELRPEVDINDGWYPPITIAIIRKVLRAELVALKEGGPAFTTSQKLKTIENISREGARGF